MYVVAMLSISIIYFSLILLDHSYAIKSLQNYTLYEVTAFNNRERAVLYYLHIRNNMIIFINGVSNEAAIPMDVLVEACCIQAFEIKLRDNDIEYFKIKDDLIFNQVNTPSIPQTHTNAYAYPVRMPNITTDFHTWERIRLWVTYKMKKHSILKEIVIGHTYEKRDIFILKVSKGRKDIAVFLLGGEDGKDWIPPAVLLNFVNNMLEHTLNLELLLDFYDFYILPVLNPDGYDYSISKERYWAKNRKVFFPQKTCSNNVPAVGVNLDRNWFINKSSLEKDEECDSIYVGSKSLSEEETEALSQFLNSIALNMMVFINVRGFEQLVTIPYAYTHLESANNYAILMDIMSAVHDKVLEDHNTTFYYGTGAEYMYNFSGNSADWVKKMFNTPVVYTIQIQSGDSIFPKVDHIQPLTGQFSTMMKEILLLANSIYGPIFNNQIVFNNTVLITVVMCIFSLNITKVKHIFV